MADKSEWKTPSMESEGKGDGHQNGRKRRTPEPIRKLKVRLGVLTPTCVVLAVFVDFCGSLSADISKFSSISVQLIGRSLGGFFQTFSGYLLFDLLVVCWR